MVLRPYAFLRTTCELMVAVANCESREADPVMHCYQSDGWSTFCTTTDSAVIGRFSTARLGREKKSLC